MSENDIVKDCASRLIKSCRPLWLSDAVGLTVAALDALVKDIYACANIH